MAHHRYIENLGYIDKFLRMKGASALIAADLFPFTGHIETVARFRGC